MKRLNTLVLYISFDINHQYRCWLWNTGKKREIRKVLKNIEYVSIKNLEVYTIKKAIVLTNLIK